MEKAVSLIEDNNNMKYPPNFPRNIYNDDKFDIISSDTESLSAEPVGPRFIFFGDFGQTTC